MKTFVIGIGGVTNGGKTTLARNLQKRLPNCSVISQDDFFKPESEIETDENGFLQYDVLEALNMEEMMSAISCWMESPSHSLVSTDWRSIEEIPILIIEGFLLFNYNTRVYDPPDAPGYFDGHVWPMYLKHRQEMENISWEIGKCPFSLQGRLFTCHCPKVRKRKDITRHFSHVLYYKRTVLFFVFVF
uniref:Nicotinamide riboside kinase 1 n=1 Tax=Sus scrofa TaxID=9823 RepID=A0A8D1IGV8_PIG